MELFLTLKLFLHKTELFNIELFFLYFNYVLKKFVLILNEISKIRTVWINWIGWNRNVFDIETVYSYYTEFLK